MSPVDKNYHTIEPALKLFYKFYDVEQAKYISNADRLSLIFNTAKHAWASVSAETMAHVIAVVNRLQRDELVENLVRGVDISKIENNPGNTVHDAFRLIHTFLHLQISMEIFFEREMTRQRNAAPKDYERIDMRARGLDHRFSYFCNLLLFGSNLFYDRDGRLTYDYADAIFAMIPDADIPVMPLDIRRVQVTDVVETDRSREVARTFFQFISRNVTRDTDIVTIQTDELEHRWFTVRL